MDAVVLDHAGSDIGEHGLAEERDQMIGESGTMPFDVDWAPLTAGRHLKFVDKPLSGVGKRLSDL